MNHPINRRDVLRAGMALPVSALLNALALRAEEGETVIPFEGTQPFNAEKPRLPWEQTTSWLTPQEHTFWVA
ncbi:MAG: hypothetical protein ACRD96_05260, partial [Bryobacteraceae bacterium]